MNMKKVIGLILLLISFMTHSQTEKETIDFINAKLRSSYGSMGGIPAIFEIKESTFFDSNEKIYRFDLFIGQPFAVYLINPKNVIEIVEYRARNGNLNLRILNDDYSILQWYIGDENKNWNNEINLVLNSDDLEIRRIKKALKYLFVLNGAVFVNDDLFKD